MDVELIPFLDMLIQMAQDSEVQKDFEAWKKERGDRKTTSSTAKPRHLYLESNLDKGL